MERVPKSEPAQKADPGEDNKAGASLPGTRSQDLSITSPRSNHSVNYPRSVCLSGCLSLSGSLRTLFFSLCLLPFNFLVCKNDGYRKESYNLNVYGARLSRYLTQIACIYTQPNTQTASKTNNRTLFFFLSLNW